MNTKHCFRRCAWPTRAVCLGLLLAMGEAGALTLVDPDLEATTFTGEPAVSVALPGGAAAGFTSYLYVVGRSDGGRIDQLIEFDAAGNELARSTLALDAAELMMGAGAYAGRVFLSEFGLPALVADGIYELHPDGSVTLFSGLGGGNPDPHGIAFGDGGTFGDFMYVANPTAGSSDARANTAIVRLDSDGDLLATLVSDPDGPYFLAMPPAAAQAEYGDYLYFTLIASNRVMRVDAAGNMSTFATLEPDDRGIALAFGIGGVFGDALYLLLNNPNSVDSRRFVRIDPDGTVVTLGTSLRGFRMAFDPDSTDLFLADEAGGVLRIGASDCDSNETGVLRFTAGARAVGEGDGTIEIPVTRACGSSGEVTLDYLLTPDTAMPADDYRHPPGSGTPQSDTGMLAFADGVATQSISIELVDNDALDGSRSFLVDLLTVTGGAVLGEPARAVITILDDEAGADLEVIDIDFPSVTAPVATFPGLGAGFNDLAYRFRVVATVRNNGPAAISGFSFELGVPKEHLAGFGQAPGSTCQVLTLDPQDPVEVHVSCTGLSLAPGATMRLPPDGAPFYVGYASTVPRGREFNYYAGVRSLGASVTDPVTSNDVLGEGLVPRTGSGGGSLAPRWLLLLGLPAWLQLRRRWRSAGIGM